jgi:hypothetical protein
MVRSTLGNIKMSSKFIFLCNERHQKDNMDVMNVNVLVGEILISYSRINESGNDFMENLNRIMDYQCW